MLGQVIKHPEAVLEFGINWRDPQTGPWLADGEDIITSTWTIPAGLTADSDEVVDGAAVVWLSGGTLGASYVIENKMSTNQGRTDVRSVEVVVRSR